MPTAYARYLLLEGSGPGALAPEPSPPLPPLPLDATRPYNVKLVQTALPLPSNVNMLTPVLGGTAVEQGHKMGVKVKMEVSWEDGEPAFGSDTGAELWVRVLSTQAMQATNVLPEEVASKITPAVLAAYNHRSCHWYGDLRQDDDETVIEWPYEQWWALPRVKVYG